MNDDQNLKNDVIFMLTDKAINSTLSSLISSGEITNPFQLAALQKMLNSSNQNLSAVNDDINNLRDFYLWWYLGYGGIQAILVAVFSVDFSFMVASASRYIHAKMLGTPLLLGRKHLNLKPFCISLCLFSYSCDIGVLVDTGFFLF